MGNVEHMMNIEINEKQAGAIVPAGIYFLRTLTNELGSEVGMQVWEQINDDQSPNLRQSMLYYHRASAMVLAILDTQTLYSHKRN